MRTTSLIAFGFGLAVVVGPVRDAQACMWDDETLFAEGGSLPCVYDAIMQTFPKHTQLFHEARIAAADAILEWDPRDVGALERKGVALLKMRKLPEAESVMQARLAVTPDDYGAHANLGTLYTFTGDFDKALVHIDRAMAIEPKAHFGREGYHKQLVLYLRDLKDGKAKDTENFLRVAVSDAERAAGKDVLKERGVPADAFDGLVAMITVYGADDVPHLYVALGDLLALKGLQRLAWAAYERARELKHPAAATVAKWQAVIEAPIKAEQKQRSDKIRKEMGGPDEGGESFARGTLRDAYKSRRLGPVNGTDFETGRAGDAADRYAAWEKKSVTAGLPVWTKAGLEEVYREAQKRVPRCTSPGVAEDVKVKQ